MKVELLKMLSEEERRKVLSGRNEKLIVQRMFKLVNVELSIPYYLGDTAVNIKNAKVNGFYSVTSHNRTIYYLITNLLGDKKRNLAFGLSFYPMSKKI